MSWTPERLALVHRHFVLDAMSASQTAKLIGGCTRNAVIGVVSRNGWGRSASAQKATSAYGGRGRPKVAVSRPGIITTPPVAIMVEQPVIAGPVAQSLNLTISDPGFRSSGCCKWPTSGQGADTLFCCIATDAIYCSQHSLRAFNHRPPLVKKRNERDLNRMIRRFV